MRPAHIICNWWESFEVKFIDDPDSVRDLVRRSPAKGLGKAAFILI